MPKKNPKEGNSFYIVKKTLTYFFPTAYRLHKNYFYLSVLHMLLAAALPFVELLLMPYLIDELIGARRIPFLLGYVLALLLLNTVIGVSESTLSQRIAMYGDSFQNYFAEELCRRSMQIDFSLTENKDVLDQINKAREGMSWYSGGVHGMASAAFQILTNAAQLFGVAALLLLRAPLLLAVILLILIFLTLINQKMNILQIKDYKALSGLNRLFAYYFYELSDFQYGKDIRLYHSSDMMQTKIKQTTKNMAAAWHNLANKSLPLSICIVLLNTLRSGCTYFYLGWLAIRGSISIGSFTQLLSASNTFHNAISGVIYGIQDIIKRTNYAYEYVKFMEYPSVMMEGNKIPAAAAAHTIEFRDVTFRYPNTEQNILEHVSIQISSGEHLSVVGLNGAGKTTFIKLLCRLYETDSGDILLDGINIKEYDYDAYTKLFAVVFQDFKLFAFSVEENITLGTENSSDQADSLCELVGLDSKMKELADGTATMVTKSFEETGVNFSGGEQQRIAIARALFQNAPVVILDEPTAALDPVAEYEIYRQFNTLVGGKTAVYISHRLSSCRFCDRIAVFSEGTIKELGTHEELVCKPQGIYAKMYAAQAQYYN